MSGKTYLCRLLAETEAAHCVYETTEGVRIQELHRKVRQWHSCFLEELIAATNI